MEEMTREIELDCDIDRAWQALTDETELSQWLGGEVDAEITPGGDLEVREEDGTVRHGFFESVEPDIGISFWWSAENEESSRVALTIEPLDGEGCLVRVVESRPMVNLESELDRIVSAGPGTGPVASAAYACV